jgi:hypothetical protein
LMRLCRALIRPGGGVDRVREVELGV